LGKRPSKRAAVNARRANEIEVQAGRAMNDLMLSWKDTPSGVIAWIRSFLKRNLPQGKCPVGIRDLSGAKP